MSSPFPAPSRLGVSVAVLCVVFSMACQSVQRDAASDTPCSDAIQLESVRVGRSVDVIATSTCHVPLFVELSFPDSRNISASEPLPLRKSVPPHATLTLVRLEPADPSREFSVASSGTALFGDKQPKPDLAYRYAFPFGGSEPRRLEQGVGGRATHTGLHHYAFDFVMPIGTPVLAARGGLVLSVKDGFPEGRLQETYRDRANQVTVLHPDGTLGMYGHLSTGIPVAEGERVETGDTLGRSGNSGYSKGPHLHFEVGSQRAGGPPQSIPVVFGDGIVPVEGESYGPQ